MLKTGPKTRPRVCENCSVTFIPKGTTRINPSSRRWCSSACKIAWWNKYKLERVMIRFHSKFSIAHNGCWLWHGSKQRGYGQIRAFDRTQWRAHRLSWYLHFGVIPDGMFVCHKCDNPSCVNPGHLFIGTCLDNVRDSVLKGRNVMGEACKRKLKEIDVSFMRKNWPRLSYSKLAKRFNVTKRAIACVIKRITWKHVQD